MFVGSTAAGAFASASVSGERRLYYLLKDCFFVVVVVVSPPRLSFRQAADAPKTIDIDASARLKQVETK